ncbi:MAG TPA: efflux RND transporter periplasmic adaptor subunit [Thermoanaerobaculia bacterium]|jgi:RND family efflux transporter MFP subunit
MNRSLVLVITGAAALLSAGCGHESQKVKETTPVRVLTAAPIAVTGGLRYSATIQPRELVQLAFKSGGYVQEIRHITGADGRPRVIQQGDGVAKGTVLARVREADYAQKVSEARASLAEAEASAERSRLDLARADKLYASKSMTRPEWEAAHATAKANRARTEAIQAQLATAETALADSAIRAPFDGIVLSRSIEENALVGQGSPAFSIADLSSVKAVFGVPDRVVSTLKLGDRLTVTTEAAPGKGFPGVLTALAPSADQKSRVFDVEVTIPNKDGMLRSGLVAAIELTPGASAPQADHTTHPAIPLSAVIQSPRGNGAYAVFTVAENGANVRARSRDVKLGRIVGNHVTVLDGLASGERVIVSGASLLSDDEPVRIVP